MMAGVQRVDVLSGAITKLLSAPNTNPFVWLSTTKPVSHMIMECPDEVLDTLLLAGLVESIFTTSMSPKAMSVMAPALLRIAIRNEDGKRAIVNTQSFVAFVRLAGDHPNKCLSRIIQTLATGDQDTQRLVISAGGLSVIMHSVPNRSYVDDRKMCLAIVSLAVYPENRPALVAAGAVPHLQRIAEEGCWGISFAEDEDACYMATARKALEWFLC